MLTELKLCNFIHFNDKQTFVIEKGLNILLGTNHSGKTSVFEAIRRCMSLSQNGGLSNPHDAKKISYATCRFQGRGHIVYSSIIRVDIFDETVTLKIAQHQERAAGDVNYGIDIIGPVKRNLGNGELVAGSVVLVDIHADACSRLLHILRADGDTDLEDAVNDFLQTVGQEQVKYFLKNTSEVKNDTKCETLLKNYVDEEAVIIFPFRSFSPYQWTKSKRDMTHLTGEILDEITIKKEIVYWYLSCSDNKLISKETRDLEEKYFDLITGNSGFKFQLVEERRVGVTNVHFAAGNPNTENLLKIPEGIYEAKSAAIVLAVQQFRTICLDDAERGMHPQMIERLRDLVLQDIDDKVVLVITHHTAFLAPWNISRTFFFQRHMDAEGYRFAVKPLRNPEYAETIGGKGPQIITSGQFANLFFAERICWIEGKTEYLFMTALKYEFLRKDSSVLEMYCSKSEEQRKRFRDFLSTLHIVSMDGEAGKLFFRRISKSLELAHFFILDYDAISSNIPNVVGQSEGTTYRGIVSNFCDAFRLKKEDMQLENINTMDAVVTTLQDQGVFVWKLTDERTKSSGAIENAVDSMRKSKRVGSELTKFLKDKNVHMNIKKGKLEKLFKNTDTKNGDITAVVKELLTLSQNDDASDFHRLVSFLKRMSEEKAKSPFAATGDSDEQAVKKRKIEIDSDATHA